MGLGGNVGTITLDPAQLPIVNQDAIPGSHSAIGNLLWNGTTSDRERNNSSVQVQSGPQTVTVNSADQVNYDARGMKLTLDITAVTGTTPTLVVKVQAKDAVSGKYIDIPGAAFTSKNAPGTFQLTIYPGITVAANVSVSDVLPRNWRCVSTIGGTNPNFTYTIAADYVK